MKIQCFILGISLVFLCACANNAGYQRHYIISDISEQSSQEDSH